MRIALFFFGLLATITVNAQESRDITYIRNHAMYAVQEMHLYKIPASITLAQGLLETGGGQSRLAEKANNHFGIKCKAEWPADKPRIYHDDDAKGECFRGYNSVQESYRDHSEFLALRPYYKTLFKLDITDYHGWAHGLKKAGYATDPSYAHKLISRIEKYNLNQFDNISENEVYAKLYSLYGNEKDKYLANNFKENKEINHLAKNELKKSSEEKIISQQSKAITSPVNSQPKIVEEPITNKVENRPTIQVEERKKNPQLRIARHPNNIAYVVAEAGETLGTLGKLYKKSPADLAKYNEIQMGTKLKEGQIVFFEMKKSKGSQLMYKVKNGDDMYTISQKFGIKISSLYKLNRMKPGEQPKEGQYISLQNKKRV